MSWELKCSSAGKQLTQLRFHCHLQPFPNNSRYRQLHAMTIA